MTLNPEDNGIWIDRLLRGELTSDEKVTFENMIREDKALGRRFSDMKEVYAGIRQSVLEEKWVLLESWDDDMSGNPDGKAEEVHADHNTRLLIWLALAALIILGAILMWPD